MMASRPHAATPFRQRSFLLQRDHGVNLHGASQGNNAGNLAAVSFLKAAAYQNGHAMYSNPLDEQTFLVNTINALEKSPFWESTAVIIAYDDSDGWHDHVMPPIVNGSSAGRQPTGPSDGGPPGSSSIFSSSSPLEQRVSHFSYPNWTAPPGRVARAK